MRPVFGAAAGLVVAMMVVGAFSMWTVIPFGWIWIGSKVSHTQQPSGGPYMVVFAGIVISICTMAWILSRLNRVYVRITGSTNLPQRYLPAWKKSLSDERGSPYGPSVLRPSSSPRSCSPACAGGLVLHRRRLAHPLPVTRC